MLRRALTGLLLLALAACSKPEAVRPALWQVEGPDGEKAWLFGTIHALPGPVDWQAGKVGPALRQADSIVLEVADITNDAATARAFTALARSPGLPPLLQRIDATRRAELAKLLGDEKLNEASFANVETWAAALTLANLLQARGASKIANGIDRAVLRAAPGKPVHEFEGAAVQLAIFDAMAEQDQRELLVQTVSGIDEVETESRRLAAAWKRGDMELIARETDGGMLTDPDLRDALLVKRNKAWTEKLSALLARGERPFVAVGAAHLAGRDGLPAMLTARGYKVTRLQ